MLKELLKRIYTPDTDPYLYGSLPMEDHSCDFSGNVFRYKLPKYKKETNLGSPPQNHHTVDIFKRNDKTERFKEMNQIHRLGAPELNSGDSGKGCFFSGLFGKNFLIQASFSISSEFSPLFPDTHNMFELDHLIQFIEYSCYFRYGPGSHNQQPTDLKFLGPMQFSNYVGFQIISKSKVEEYPAPPSDTSRKSGYFRHSQNEIASAITRTVFIPISKKHVTILRFSYPECPDTILDNYIEPFIKNITSNLIIDASSEMQQGHQLLNSLPRGEVSPKLTWTPHSKYWSEADAWGERKLDIKLDGTSIPQFTASGPHCTYLSKEHTQHIS